MTTQYDVLISHRSDHRAWVRALRENLRRRHYQPLILGHRADLGDPLPSSSPAAVRKVVLVVTPGAVEDGWVSTEYEAMVALRDRNPDFIIVPVLLGCESPFVDGVPVVAFRGSADAVYRRSFYELLCRLEGREPKPTTRDDGDLEIPESPRTPAQAPDGSEQRLVDAIFAALPRSGVVMLLAQADRARPGVIAAILERARAGHGTAATFDLMPPWSDETAPDRFFARLARHCGMDESVANAGDWEDALDRRLSRGEQLFILVRGFENGSETGRAKLGGILRSLSERYPGDLQVVLCGGERLAELKYARGNMSLLNCAEVVRWPELTAEDVLAWHRRDDPDGSLDADAAAEILEICGGHPRLVAFCLERHRRQPWTRSPNHDELQPLRQYDVIWQLFTPHRENPAARDRIRAWLAEDDLGPDDPWPADSLLRRLYWSNVLTGRDGRLTWRCDLLREVGRRVLSCD
jgi:hypothetical protein